MEILLKTFNELSLEELYQILQLRSEVFVVEQDCVYQDIDGKDQKALHVLGLKEGKVIAYTRCFDKGFYFDEAAIGRVVVKENQRKFGYGHLILKASILAIEERFKTNNIKLSAQQYLTDFYESHGFMQIGEGYLEDGIPHIAMVK
ncbi:GNAT family N-acetyltransferase [Salegentibacter sp. JZCK2]|uniref:GNAT family N-acetyltransferase n=1 Tax=Salegentibacter tibetensis TaxID=2873600 RepID=UPI001CCF1CFD|nr:GNAT family N-acetyltransferase [Salegentibacter tibetensis]MBZ9730667.1 GNAT family N-acetyltransferase [Salegentibacter tibetensis]